MFLRSFGLPSRNHQRDNVALELQLRREIRVRIIPRYGLLSRQRSSNPPFPVYEVRSSILTLPIMPVHIEQPWKMQP